MNKGSEEKLREAAALLAEAVSGLNASDRTLTNLFLLTTERMDFSSQSSAKRSLAQRSTCVRAVAQNRTVATTFP